MYPEGTEWRQGPSWLRYRDAYLHRDEWASPVPSDYWRRIRDELEQADLFEVSLAEARALATAREVSRLKADVERKREELAEAEARLASFEPGGGRVLEGWST